MAMAADHDFEWHRKSTRRDHFLETMNRVVPWDALCAVVEPYYPKNGNGRPPIGLERMLHFDFLPHWFNLANPACEEALYDSASLRRFASIDLGSEPVPDATTILKFRRLLEQHKLAERLFAEVDVRCRATVWRLKLARLSMRPSLASRVGSRTQTSSVIPRCTRQGKVSNGILA